MWPVAALQAASDFLAVDLLGPLAVDFRGGK